MAIEKMFTVEEVREEVLEGKVGRNTLYSAIKSGALRSRKIGRRILITEQAVTAWLDSLTQQVG